MTPAIIWPTDHSSQTHPDPPDPPQNHQPVGSVTGNIWGWFEHKQKSLLGDNVLRTFLKNSVLHAVVCGHICQQNQNLVWWYYFWPTSLKNDFRKYSSPYGVGCLSRGIDGTSSKQFTDLYLVKLFWRKISKTMFYFLVEDFCQKIWFLRIFFLIKDIWPLGLDEKQKKTSKKDPYS